ncbi:hypothetical protein P4O66_012565, partial [Electrophorus voltai]
MHLSKWSYYPFKDYHKGYVDYERNREYSDISLRSDSEFDHGEDPLMEVEEVLHRDPSSGSDTEAADYKSEEPLAAKTPPKAPPSASPRD